MTPEGGPPGGEDGPAADTAGRRWRAFLLVVGSWTAFALLEAGHGHLWATIGLHQYPARGGLGYRLVDTLGAIAMTPVALWLARRYPLERPSARSIVVHFFGAAAVAMAVSVATFVVNVRVQPTMPSLDVWILLAYSGELLRYVLVVAVATAAMAASRSQARSRREARLELELVRAQLGALQAQLQPHFLFNALHTIAEMVHGEPREAERVITRLGDLLRMTLERSELQTVPLRDELLILAPYVDIQSARFQDRLRLEVCVPEELMSSPVPTLLLQPLVENAIRHGLEPRPEPTTIRIRASRAAGRIRLEVRDDGAGYAPDPARRHGIGLANIRTRLARLYGADHLMRIEGAPGRGTSVVVEIPLPDA